MPTHEDTSLFTGELCALARDQLQMQTSRSGTLDAGALGVMALDVALAAIVIGARGAHGLWIAALVLLVLSLGLALRALRHVGAEETGPPVARLRLDRETHDEQRLRESMLEDLASGVLANKRDVARKAAMFDRALAPLVLAILIEIAGRLL